MRYVSRQSGAAAFATVLASLLCSTAYAQVATPPAEASSAEANPDGTAEVLVTGTRIRRPDLASNSPLTAVSAKELSLQGANNVENVLNRLPQFTPDANENVSNGSDGTAQVNLRNLGSNRVLTLINGQRYLPTQATDLNFIPSAIVDRIDVVTGGASAVYGSDAISGVVNFIVRDRLEGFRMDAQTSVSDHTNNNDFIRSIVSGRGYTNAPRHVFDGAKQDINAALGHSFFDGRLNLTVYGGYRHTEPVLQSSRDVSACALSSTGTSFSCGGSSNTPYGTFIPLGGPNMGTKYSNNIDGTKTWTPYVTAIHAYNYAPLNYIQRVDDRYNAGGFLHFDISSAAQLYGSFMYMKDKTFSQIAPSALWLGQTYAVTCNNPLMSSSQQQMLCGSSAGTATTQNTFIGYRLGGNGTLPRRDDLQHNYYRMLAGLRGDLGHGFGYDVSVMRSVALYNERFLNDVNVTKAQRALLAVPDGKGGAVCQSVLDGSDKNCLPINVFQAGGLTGTQASYLYAPSRTWARNTLDVVTGTITGDLGTYGIKTPWAHDGLSIALGGEHRRETLFFTGDAIAKQNGTQDSDGIIAVNEGFGEFELPLVQDAPFARAISLNGGFRYSAYKNRQDSTHSSSSYNTFTYKAELSWQVINAVRLRASYNRAIRAPNIGELFSNLSLGNVNTQDPCAGPTPSASLASCQLTGVTAAQYNAHSIIECPADQCTAQFGGNRGLKPEKADTYTVGIVVAPRGGRNFSFSLDYYHIKVLNYIGSIDPNTTIDACFQTKSPYYCGLFHRDPITGAIFGTGYVVATTLNTGFLKTSGLDVTGDLTFHLGKFGTLNTNLVGSYLFDSVSQPLPGGSTYDCKGLFGYSCGQPSPAWRHTVRTTWAPSEVFNLSLAWRYIGPTSLNSSTPDPIDQRLAAYNYFDLTASATIGKNLSLRIGANNLFDKNPPALDSGVLVSFGNGNTYPGVYDTLGRRLFAGATVKF